MIARISTIIGMLFVTLAAIAGWQLLVNPNTPLPHEWNPLKPLVISAPPTPLTGYKLERVLDDPDRCLRTLEQRAEFRQLPPLNDSPQCFIANRVELRTVSGVILDPVETSCETALRLTMWVEHDLNPAAQESFNQSVRSLGHIGSYNCRRIRGSSDRMSSHATASSIDISSVTLSNGTRISLLGNWDNGDTETRFFRTVRDGGCDWFQTVLGPEFNALHADHFHFQSRGWGTCR